MLRGVRERRYAKLGFPRPIPLQTREEIEEYFTCDPSSITCLECGRELRWIGHKHLGFIHGMTVNEYKLKYGLPLTAGLVCAETSDIHRINFIPHQVAGIGLPNMKGHTIKGRKRQPFFKAELDKMRVKVGENLTRKKLERQSLVFDLRLYGSSKADIAKYLGVSLVAVAKVLWKEYTRRNLPAGEYTRAYMFKNR